MSDVSGLDKKSFDRAADAAALGARRRSEGVTLALAVVAAVTLGVAFGTWINARLTPRSSAEALRPARLLPEASASVSPAPAARPTPCDGCETSSVNEATPARSPAAGKVDEARPGADALAPTGEAGVSAPDAGSTPSRAVEVAAGSDEPRSVTRSEAVAAARPDPSRPVAWQVGAHPRARAVARANVEGGAAQSVGKAAGSREQGQSGPCSLYASASALSVRLGGAVPLVLGGPNAGVRINVSTPDWSQLAVIYEGPAAVQNGWLRYSVKSVGRRPGLYTLHVSSPCGSQTILVTVK